MNKLKDKKKLIIGVIAIIMIVGSLAMLNGEKEKDNKDGLQTQMINTDIPFDDNRETIKNKEDAYKKEMKDNNDKKDKEEKGKKDFSNINLDGVGDNNNKKLTSEEKVDSILNANKIFDENSTDEKKKKKTNKNTNNKKYSSGSTGGNYSNYNTTNKKTTGGKKNNWDAEKEKSNLNGFFNNSSGSENKDGKYDKIIYAVIYGNKNTPEGGRVSLRLSNDAVINNKKYKRNTLLYAFAKFGENRVFLTVKKINDDFVNLDVYDTQDGLKGIYTEEKLINKTVNESSDDVSLKGVPIEKIGKKILNATKRNEKVMLFNGYKVYMKKGKK